MELTKLSDLAAKALAKIERPTFGIEKDVEVKVSSTGNVGFRATLSDGSVVTFWKSNMEQVVEAIDEKTFTIKVGTQIAQDGGLIPAGSVSGGFWGK